MKTCKKGVLGKEASVSGGPELRLCTVCLRKTNTSSMANAI